MTLAALLCLAQAEAWVEALGDDDIARRDEAQARLARTGDDLADFRLLLREPRDRDHEARLGRILSRLDDLLAALPLRPGLLRGIREAHLAGGGGAGGGAGGPVQSRLTVAWAVFPEESVTVIVITLVPVPSGTVAVQVPVPVAVPEVPVNALVHVMVFMPELSDAVPVITAGLEAAGPEAGPEMAKVGGVVSPEGGGPLPPPAASL